MSSSVSKSHDFLNIRKDTLGGLASLGSGTRVRSGRDDLDRDGGESQFAPACVFVQRE